MGKTIIEKIENYTNVEYTIVLYTPCDRKLGRERVCPLMKGFMKDPSDILGIVYKKWMIMDGGNMKLPKRCVLSDII